ncbi:hypothetical protein E5Q_03057 [Mixia osmundae IAM 14324]|uniref:Anoctamin dimerisation domain-containing protein n=2 Tax=Mixia osmundae (strain CBS 9802 / IAM 14324 / JCM 22182 / KY 12970) TaxID=764103 RepID=G7E0N0_MIXOS|nr:hypothetical protein E5Q_03057 [Mixia osmundae IAM 14324]
MTQPVNTLDVPAIKGGSSLPPRTSSTGEQTINVDYVLVYDYASKPKSARDDVAANYRFVVSKLKEAGLHVTSRLGAPKSDQILIFVRCPDELMLKELKQERLDDWLHGISSTKQPDPKSERDFISDPVSEGERLRHVYTLITGYDDESVNSSQATRSNRKAGITPGTGHYTRVKAIFPPHNPKFNKDWLQRWTSWSHVVSIPAEELDRVKDHFGEDIALYFEFLRYYFTRLVVPSALGTAVYLAKWEYHPVYSIVLILWAIIFVEGWTMREKVLSVRWQTHALSTKGGRRRAQFKPATLRTSPVTGLQEPFFPWYNREGRILATVPALAVFSALLSGLICIIYTAEVLINEVYDGPGKKAFSLIPTIAFAGLVPQVVALWTKVAGRLTNWENHEHENHHYQSLTLKTFALNALVSFGALTFTGYIYVPFGRLVIPQALSLLANKGLIDANHAASPKFDINSNKLRNTLIALTTTSQAVGAFTEIGLPMLLRLLSSKTELYRSTNPKSSPSDDPEEHAFLERIRHEAALPDYSLFVEYAEMVVQFGYTVLFSVVWPIAPVTAFVNNFFELRSDTFKLCSNSRRPVPTRTDTIGPWLRALSVLVWLGAMTNASLIYMYAPGASHRPGFLSGPPVETIISAAENITGTALTHKSIHGNFATTHVHYAATAPDPLSALKSTLFSALLVALACEHLFLFVKEIIRHVVTRILWFSSKEEAALQRADYVLKKTYLETLDLNPKEIDRSQLEESGAKLSSAHAGTFWSKHDPAVDIINSASKTD